jgi:hypothetical protein
MQSGMYTKHNNNNNNNNNNNKALENEFLKRSQLNGEAVISSIKIAFRHE